MTTTMIDSGLTDRDLQAFADELVAKLRESGNGAAGKDFGTAAGPIRDKAWWSDVFQVVSQVAPVLVGALGGQKSLAGLSEADQKNFWDDFGRIASSALPVILSAIGGAGKGLAGGTQPGSKAWYDDVMHVVAEVTPTLVQVLAGQKGPHVDDKSFWDDVVHTVVTVAPYVIAAVA